MNIYLLDGVGAVFFVFLFGLGAVFLLIAIFTEAWIMVKMKYIDEYRKALPPSVTANLVTLIVGFLIISKTGVTTSSDWLNIALLFVSTVAVESVVLYLMNKDKPVSRAVRVSLVMNLVTYAIAYLILLSISN